MYFFYFLFLEISGKFFNYFCLLIKFFRFLKCVFVIYYTVVYYSYLFTTFSKYVDFF
jgi:hypothetical protein